jgi:type IV secretory pathway VirB2 component (pilin)
MIKNIKTKFRNFCIFSSVSFSQAVFAASDASDLFEPLNDKMEQLTDELVTWASILCVFCVVVFGTLTMLGKFSKFWAMCIVGGSLIVLVAASLASFLLGS